MTKRGEQVRIDNKIYTCRKFPASYFQNINTLMKTQSKAKPKKQKIEDKIQNGGKLQKTGEKLRM